MNKDIQKGAASTPFLLKLWDMLEEPGNEHIIAWDPFGESFEVKRPDLMSSGAHEVQFLRPASPFSLLTTTPSAALQRSSRSTSSTTSTRRFNAS